MVYNTQDYWVFGLCPSSGTLKNMFQKLDLFPHSGEEVGENPIMMGCQEELVSSSGFFLMSTT
jgi:hypothetical protein